MPFVKSLLGLLRNDVVGGGGQLVHRISEGIRVHQSFERNQISQECLRIEGKIRSGVSYVPGDDEVREGEKMLTGRRISKGGQIVLGQPGNSLALEREYSIDPVWRIRERTSSRSSFLDSPEPILD
jgi:hypothetical protein